MFANDSHLDSGDDDDKIPMKQHQPHDHLSTARLRQLGIITDQGRVADLDANTL